jgi:hypothetical protein
VSDEPLFRPATYGDESYEADPRTSGVTVGATFAHDAEMTWHAALLLQMRTGEAKYGQFRRARPSLPGVCPTGRALAADVATRVVRCLRCSAAVGGGKAVAWGRKTPFNPRETGRQAAARMACSCLNHAHRWFQLAKMRLTSSRPTGINNLEPQQPNRRQ